MNYYKSDWNIAPCKKIFKNTFLVRRSRKTINRKSYYIDIRSSSIVFHVNVQIVNKIICDVSNRNLD